MDEPEKKHPPVEFDLNFEGEWADCGGSFQLMPKRITAWAAPDAAMRTWTAHRQEPPSGLSWVGEDYTADAEVEKLRAERDALAARVEIKWQPIATAPVGVPVLLYLPGAERGHPSFAVGQRWDDAGDDWCWWGPGGPNGGLELDMSIGCYGDGPTLWAPLDALLASARAALAETQGEGT